MPAPDFQTLYDLETQLEVMWKAVLQPKVTAILASAIVYTTRDPLTKKPNRVDLSVTIGAPLSQMTTANQARPKQQPNAFDFAISAVVCTSRAEGAASVTHGPLRGVVRYALSAGARLATDQNLPYLQILDLLPFGGTPQVYDEKQTDKTELVFSGKVAIRNDAWPAQA